jgi:outer membrane protein assembly factor BamA
VYLSLKASAFPKAWDLEEAMAKLEGEASLALAPRGRWQPSINLFVGGVKTFGDRIPFFETARLGGLRTLRGYNFDRFAGEASVYGSAELRLPVTRIKFVVPGQQGFFGFYDAGRVYVEGEDSDEFHAAVGGGFWMSFLTRASVAFIGVAKPVKDKEGNRIIAGFGFPF